MSKNAESVSGSFPSSFPSLGAKTRVRNKERSVSAHEPWALREECGLNSDCTRIFISLSGDLLKGFHHGCIVDVLGILETK